jgi:hypothetical protein
VTGPLRRAAAAVRQAARRRAEAPGRTPELPSPLTAQRVADDLARRGYRFRTDDDGDITGTWDGNRFWFLRLGEDAEILQVRGRWSGSVPEQARGAVLQACNDWNRERLWPKVYARHEDDTIALYGEVSVDLEHGVTDDQIAETLSCGLVATSQFFASLASLGDPAPPSP